MLHRPRSATGITGSRSPEPVKKCILRPARDEGKNYRIMATGDFVNGETELAWLDSLASIGDSLNTLEDKEFISYAKII